MVSSFGCQLPYWQDQKLIFKITNMCLTIEFLALKLIKIIFIIIEVEGNEGLG
jgi:hypothetical protein